MAHHKRRKPKSARSGCLLCKPWKANGSKRSERQRFGDYKRIYYAKLEMINDLQSLSEA